MADTLRPMIPTIVMVDSSFWKFGGVFNFSLYAASSIFLVHSVKRAGSSISLKTSFEKYVNWKSNLSTWQSL